jgi:hypoxanthine-DNA glycosylase
MTRSHGFAPIARPDARVLILGSLPGAESLARQQYYAHPRNVFWRIMGEVVGAGPELSYADRGERLMACGIALGDVCLEATRAGSLDSAISAPQANDFTGFFAEHQMIQSILFNGRAAEGLFSRLVRPQLSPAHAAIACHALPSTSPAHASMPFAEKSARWRQTLISGIESATMTVLVEGPPP